MRRRIEEGAEKIRFSRFLVTIRTDVPVDLDLESFRSREPDLERLTQLFDELEFRSLTDRVKKNRGIGDKKPTAQLDLFAAFPESGTLDRVLKTVR